MRDHAFRKKHCYPASALSDFIFAYKRSIEDTSRNIKTKQSNTAPKWIAQRKPLRSIFTLYIMKQKKTSCHSMMPSLFHLHFTK